MTPEFATPGATSAASPWSLTEMCPSFTTVAAWLADGMSKMSRPAMKFALVMSAGVATREFTSTTLPFRNRMPAPLTIAMPPLAMRWPAMSEGSPPNTRLRMKAPEFGWMNCVVSPAPMLKLCQLMMARSDCSTTVTVLGDGVVIVALPAATVPPAGLASAGPAKRAASPRAAAAQPCRQYWRAHPTGCRLAAFTSFASTSARQPLVSCYRLTNARSAGNRQRAPVRAGLLRRWAGG